MGQPITRFAASNVSEPFNYTVDYPQGTHFYFSVTDSNGNCAGLVPDYCQFRTLSRFLWRSTPC